MFFIWLDSEKIESNLDNETKREIDASLFTLDEKNLDLSSNRHSIDILPTNIHIAANQINSMLRSTGNRSGAFAYRYRDIGVYTMSAQSIDGSQHLVHRYLEGYQPFAVDNVMMPLYVLSQRKSYMLDEKQYGGRAEVWQTSRQAFYYPRGDCEDHAIALADWLIEMGEDARIALGDWDGQGHAWVVLFKDGREYLLESTKKSGLSRTQPYPVAALHTNYHPKYMFNRQYFWENTGSKYTTDYSNQRWKKKSRYNAVS